MRRFEFDLATESDDAALRQILSETPMPGSISVTFQREPNYFAGSVVDGPFRQVGVCRETETQRVIGFGCRSIRIRYVNGTPQPIGYLGLLRLLREYRNIGLVARGYQYLRQLHRDGRTQLYLTTIAKGNERAIATLSSARAGLPGYHPAGDYHTAVIPLGRRSRHKKTVNHNILVRRAVREDLNPLLEFLSRVGSTRQFFPQYELADFFQPHATFKDLRPEDLLLAFQDRRLVGVLGGWDQQHFRQTVVQRLHAPLRWCRPIYNGLATMNGRPKLPRVGEAFRYVTGVLPVVENDDREVFAALLDTFVAQDAQGQHDYLLLGMHESDPLVKLAVQRATTTYVTHLYYVCWSDGDALRSRLDDRPPYLELGCL